jgi:hypothetical protein
LVLLRDTLVPPTVLSTFHQKDKPSNDSLGGYDYLPDDYLPDYSLLKYEGKLLASLLNQAGKHPWKSLGLQTCINGKRLLHGSSRRSSVALWMNMV